MAGDGEEQDEDYMGDLSQFITPDFSQSSSSSSKKRSSSGKQLVVLNSLSDKKPKPKVLNWQEQRKLKRERTQIEEDKQTLENLGSAIPQSNIGFKLLKRMGYTPGSALGKEGSGRIEPVGVQIRRGRGGIGKEDPKVEKMRKEMENAQRDKRNVEDLMQDFGTRQKERWRGKRIVVNFHKAEAVLAQLENNNNNVVEDVEKKEEKDEEKEEDEEEAIIMEEDLLNLLLKLRDEFHYCLFCGCQYETVEALTSNCPGINEDDH